VVYKWGGLRKVKGVMLLCVDTQSPEDKRDVSDKMCISIYILTPIHLNIRPISQNIIRIYPCTDAYSHEDKHGLSQ
jgi:hypothetical protein